MKLIRMMDRYLLFSGTDRIHRLDYLDRGMKYDGK